MYLGVAGHMLAFYGKKMKPRAGLLLGQAVAASKAITNIPTWMGYFAKWRVRCVSLSEASEILVGCKRIEKENLRQTHGNSRTGSPLCSLSLPLLLLNHSNPRPLCSLPERMRHPEPTLFDMDCRSSPTPGFTADSPREGHSQANTHLLMMTEYPRIPPSQMGPPEGGVGAEEAEVARVVETLMGLTPLG